MHDQGANSRGNAKVEVNSCLWRSNVNEIKHKYVWKKKDYVGYAYILASSG